MDTGPTRRDAARAGLAVFTAASRPDGAAADPRPLPDRLPYAPKPGAPFYGLTLINESGRWSLIYVPGRAVGPPRVFAGAVDEHARDVMLGILACAEVLAELGEEETPAAG